MRLVLERLDGERFSQIMPVWSDQTVVLLGGGPSLTTQQVDCVQRAHAAGKVKCIAVNDAYLLAPWAELNYFADAKWWEWHTTGVERSKLSLSAQQVKQAFADFKGQKCSIQNSMERIKDDAVHILRNCNDSGHGFGLSADPARIVTGRNSGFQALNIAVLAGAKKIILLGYDAKEPIGQSHWFGEHPSPTPVAVYPELRRSFSAAQDAIKEAGVEVFNCSPGSAIDTFPKAALEEVLA